MLSYSEIVCRDKVVQKLLGSQKFGHLDVSQIGVGSEKGYLLSCNCVCYFFIASFNVLLQFFSSQFFFGTGNKMSW